jgi:hypothetical protein
MVIENSNALRSEDSVGGNGTSTLTIPHKVMVGGRPFAATLTSRNLGYRQHAVRLHFYVSKQLAERIAKVGSMLGHAKARTASFLLDNASQVEHEAIAVIDRRLNAATVNGNGRAKSVQNSTSDSAGEVVLMYVRLDPQVAVRIARLAEKKNVSLSKVCAWLLSRAADDDQWIVNIVQDRLTQALAKVPSEK